MLSKGNPLRISDRRRTVHDVNLFGDAFLGISHEKEQKGTQHRGRGPGQWSLIRVRVFKQRRDGGKIGRPEFYSERPVFVDENNARTILGVKLLENKAW